MISVASIRKGLKNLSLVGLTVMAVVSVAIAAVPGFPFTEDFANDTLKGAGTTAEWDSTAPDELRMGFASDLTAMTLNRLVLGGAGEVSHSSRDVVLGDLDGDGDLDAVVGDEGPLGQFGASGGPNLIYFNSAGVFNTAPVAVDGSGQDNKKTLGMSIGDIDNDGHLDLVACNYQENGAYYLNDSFGNFSAATQFTNFARRSWRCELLDVDADGDLDYVEANWNGPNSFYQNLLIESGDGTLSFAPERRITADQFETRSIAFGDIDNDGDVDIVAGDQNGANHIYRWFDGDFVARDIVHNNNNITFSLALADVDADGYLDLVEGNAAAPTQVYLNQGAGNAGFFGNPTILADSNAGHVTVDLLLRDMDRDGDIDIVEGNNGAWDDDNDGNTPVVPQPLRMYLNNGNGTFANGIDFLPPEIQKIYGMAAGDVDQDGRLDFVTAHSINNEGGPAAPSFNAVYMNGGTPGAGNVRQLGSVAVSAADVDGASAGVPTARLTVTKAQPAVLAQMAWYLSNDGGTTFVRTQPGVPVAFPNPNGSQLTWKVEMLTHSPNVAQTAQISQIDIAGNGRPIFTDQGDLAGVEGQNILSTLALYFSDPDGDPLTYQISGLPAGTGVTLDAQTGVLSGVPTNDDAINSPIALTISASDGAESRSGNISMTVTNAVNDPPTANDDGPYAVDEGGAIASAFNVLDNDTDPDTANLNAVLVDAPANSALFELKPDGTFDYTHDGSETATDSFTYRADDGGSQSNVATVSLTINPVNDVPIITLAGSATVNIKVGDAYVDAGATANDDEDGDISANIVVGGDTVDPNTDGIYVVTYDVADSGASAATQVTRTVNVATNSPPVITLTGNAAITLTTGDAYADAGATAMDDEDGDITANIVVGGTVNTAAAGTYTLTYNVMDMDGNAATEATRTVTVNNPPPPPKKKSGGGTTGLLEFFGLGFAGLVMFRRRRARKLLA